MKKIIAIVVLALCAWIIAPASAPAAQVQQRGGDIQVQGQSEHYLVEPDTIGNNKHDWYWLKASYHPGFGPMYPGSIAVTQLGMAVNDCEEYERDTRMHVDWLVLRNENGVIRHSHYDWDDHKCNWWDLDLPSSGIVINDANCAKVSARTDPKIDSAGDHPDQNAIIYICNNKMKAVMTNKVPAGYHYGKD